MEYDYHSTLNCSSDHVFRKISSNYVIFFGSKEGIGFSLGFQAVFFGKLAENLRSFLADLLPTSLLHSNESEK